MKRRQIHPITPWIAAVLFLVGGGIAFQVWAQQSPEPMQATMATLAARPLLGSISVPAQPGESESAGGAATPTPPTLSPLPEKNRRMAEAESPGVLVQNSAEGAAAKESAPNPPQSPDMLQGVSAPEAEFGEVAVDEALEQALRLALGPNTRMTPRLAKVTQYFHVLYIEWSINDHLMPNQVVPGAQKDVAALLQVVRQSGSSYQFIHFVGTYPIRSDAGRLEETPVLWLTFAAHDFPQIEWDQPVELIAPQIFDTAEHLRLHPSLPK